MKRKEVLLKAFQRGHLLNLKNPIYKSWIEKFIVDETRGDVGSKGDITSNAVIKSDKKLKAIVMTRERGIVAGLEETVFLYKKNGIDVNQIILKIPVSSFKESGSEVPAIIGKRMAKSAMLNVDDRVLVRWRDKNGTFDAIELKIVEIFKTDVPSVDNGQIWIPLDDLQKMTGMINEASILVAKKEFIPDSYEGWVFKDLDFLFTDLDNIIQQKKIGQSVMVGLLLIIALLAIFDTQVLSICRRQK